MSQLNNTKILSGSVERVTFHNAENGFCVVKVKVNGKKDLVAVLGSVPAILAGEQIEATGYWEKDAEHGFQFKAQTLKVSAPSSLDGIEKYLASGLIKGIGPTYAKKMVEQFYHGVFDIIEKEPVRLKEIAGLGGKRIELITKSWETQKVIREIMLFLHSHNISTSTAMKIYRTYGRDSIKIMQENPYKLAQDVRGIGFKSADIIAQNIGIDKNSIQRARSGITHALASAMNEGHCGLPKQRLLSLTAELLNIEQELVQEALRLELEDELLISYDLYEDIEKSDKYNECVFLKGLAIGEKFIANKLRALSMGKRIWPRFENSNEVIKQTASKLGISLSNNQMQAVAEALNGGVLIITGGPGVGKTTVINTIIKILATKDIRIMLAAPTGRAAKKMSEATGLPASTIHRLIKRSPDQDYKHNVTLKCDLLIIDEMSMVDVSLMYSVLKALPENVAVILVGDIDQLPSVGPGKVLGDLIKSAALNVVKLTEIFRQGKESNIISNAHKINKGIMPSLVNNRSNKHQTADQPNRGNQGSENEYHSSENRNSENHGSDFVFIESDEPEQALEVIVSLVRDRLPKKFGLSPTKDIQVLCPMTKGTLGTKNLNIRLQEALISQKVNFNNYNNQKISNDSISTFGNNFYINDKVMQIVNNYDLEVFNGDIGVVISINNEDKQLIVKYEVHGSNDREVVYEKDQLDELVLAYAITIHKSQGSEYPVIIVPVFMQHYIMLKRNLLYTAVTRGKKLVILIGQTKAIALAVQNKSEQPRYTSLYQRLYEVINY